MLRGRFYTRCLCLPTERMKGSYLERFVMDTLPQMPCARDEEKSSEYCRCNLAWLVEVNASRNWVSVRHAEKCLMKVVSINPSNYVRNNSIISGIATPRI